MHARINEQGRGGARVRCCLGAQAAYASCDDPLATPLQQQRTCRKSWARLLRFGSGLIRTYSDLFAFICCRASIACMCVRAGGWDGAWHIPTRAALHPVLAVPAPGAALAPPACTLGSPLPPFRASPSKPLPPGLACVPCFCRLLQATPSPPPSLPRSRTATPATQGAGRDVGRGGTTHSRSR